MNEPCDDCKYRDDPPFSKSCGNCGFDYRNYEPGNIPNNANNGWISVKDRLPEKGQDVILLFRDTFHKHDSWPRIAVKSAWLCNVGEPESPNGAWAIEARLYNQVVDLEDGIAWMPMPEPPKEG